MGSHANEPTADGIYACHMRSLPEAAMADGPPGELIASRLPLRGVAAPAPHPSCDAPAAVRGDQGAVPVALLCLPLIRALHQLAEPFVGSIDRLLSRGTGVRLPPGIAAGRTAPTA